MSRLTLYSFFSYEMWLAMEAEWNEVLPLPVLFWSKVSAWADHLRQNYQIHLDYKMTNKKQVIQCKNICVPIVPEYVKTNLDSDET